MRTPLTRLVLFQAETGSRLMICVRQALYISPHQGLLVVFPLPSCMLARGSGSALSQNCSAPAKSRNSSRRSHSRSLKHHSHRSWTATSSSASTTSPSRHPTQQKRRPRGVAEQSEHMKPTSLLSKRRKLHGAFWSTSRCSCKSASCAGRKTAALQISP